MKKLLLLSLLSLFTSCGMSRSEKENAVLVSKSFCCSLMSEVWWIEYETSIFIVKCNNGESNVFDVNTEMRSICR